MNVKIDVVRRINWYVFVKSKILLVIKRHFTALQQGASGAILQVEQR